MPDPVPPPAVDPARQALTVPAFRVRQPVGDMYIASLSHKQITRIAYFDVRRIQREEREVETYLGIQRPLNLKRVDEIGRYVNFQDASFPGAIIVSIDGDYADFDEGTGQLTIRNHRLGEEDPTKAMRDIARVLDGQHRIAGLEQFRGDAFDVVVTIFIGADISDQAYIFATVNLEQNKVNKSLVYDLFALAKSRSPQKSCHNIAVAFDRDVESPFYKRIKRLGTATPGRDFETLSQATFVESLLAHVSNTPKADRDSLLRGRHLPSPTRAEIKKLIFRKMFVEDRDLDIAKVYHEYFSAVKERWPLAWEAQGLGYMLNRTNGYRALSRFLRPAYLKYGDGSSIISRSYFLKTLQLVRLKDEDFTIDTFPPGTSGESLLFRRLMSDTGLDQVDFS